MSIENNQKGIDVIINDLQKNPVCPHGPTLLFSRKIKDSKRNFFACSAYRDRKHCTFFMWEDERTPEKEAWKQERLKFLKKINHRKLFLFLNKIQNLSVEERIYCHTCSKLDTKKFIEKHDGHNIKENISDYLLKNPSEMLMPLDTSKKEAQYLFSKNSVTVIVNILQNLGYKNIICIGTPRIHEFIKNNCPEINSLLLDIDCRFHNFFGPLEFCWYNMFNHHFFFEESRNIYSNFLQSINSSETALITDPPFGGRVEPIAHTFNIINNEFKNINNVSLNLPIFWVFPYFMEPHILNALPNFTMLDYKVDYDNHNSFNDSSRGRRNGSPVRIFTNVLPSLIKLPEDTYKYCKKCKKWVSKENRHCQLCNACTSKNGSTYVHCKSCDKCVKPTWQHCKVCGRCALVTHKCQKLTFSKECFHCNKQGHKKSECPDLDNINKRKMGVTTKKSKKRKCNKIN